jgi:DNA-directed RNA polymerase subunit M/transcription elongation factor TFIIS
LEAPQMTDSSQLPTLFRCECPHCNAQLKHNGTRIGATVKCPKCESPFRIPEVEEISQAQTESNETANSDDAKTDLRERTTTGVETTTSGKPPCPRSPDGGKVSYRKATGCPRSWLSVARTARRAFSQDRCANELVSPVVACESRR